MKLLFFISSLGAGGAERVMVTLCNELVNKGHDVYLATNKLIPFAYDLNEAVNVVELYPSNYLNIPKGYRHLKFYQNIRHICKKIQPSVMVSFIYKLNAHVVLATRGLQIPIIVSEHSTFDKKRSFIEYLFRFQVNKLADKVILLTQHDFDFLGKRLPSKLVIPNPLAYSLHKDKMERNKTILAAGNLNRWDLKGFDNLIEIWGRVSPLFPDWRLQIAGSGRDENLVLLKKIATDNGVATTIDFLGFQSDMNLLMQQSSIFVLSSRREGLPMVLLEAMSQGCACISYDCKTGPKEIILQDRTGILVENQNHKEMERSLITLMQDDKLRSELSENALKDIQRYLKENIIQKWEDLILSLSK